MLDLSISEAAELLRQKKISPVDLASACLDRIERLNPMLNAFITVTHESALAQAREAEDEIQRGQWRGPLHGIPIGLKDLIDTAGVRTTCGSALFAERVPTEDAFVVQRLKRAGAVLLGKQNLQEFAYGGPRHQATTARSTIPGTPNISPEVLRVDLQPRWPQACVSARSVLTRAARFASRQPFAASLASSQLTGA